MKIEQTKKANEVLQSVKDDLQTEQGQLLLRVLKMLSLVQQNKKDQQKSFSHPRASQQESQAAEGPEETAEIPPTRQEKEQQLIDQVYAVRMQALITSQVFRESDEMQKKQHIGTLIFDNVRMFVEQVVVQLKLVVPGAQQPNHGLTPKVTGMIMSLPLTQLLVSVSRYEGLA